MNTVLEEKPRTTADLADAEEMASAQREINPEINDVAVETTNSEVRSEAEQLVPLFLPDVAKDFRSQWNAVQSSFVDDPKQAVQRGDQLVAEVMTNLAATFSTERAKLGVQLEQTGEATTENLRVALRRYRSFFERLLSL